MKEEGFAAQQGAWLPAGAGANSPRDDMARSDLVMELVAYLTEGISVDLIGMRGSGRSTVLRQVRAHLASQDVECITISGNRALRHRPLSALSGEGWFAAHLSMPPSLPAGIRMLSDALESPNAIIIIDDADEVDEVSAGAILAARGRHPVLMATRPTAKRRQGVLPNALTHVQGCVQLTIPPLRFDQIHLLLRGQFSGAIAPSAVARISTKAGGLPGLINEIVVSAQLSGLFAQRDGQWHLNGALWTEHLITAAESYLDDLNPEHIDVLTQFAVLGGSSFDTLQKIAALEMIDQLESDGVIRVLDDQAATFVGIYPPLLTEYLVRHGGRASKAKAHHLAVGGQTIDGEVVVAGDPSSVFDAESSVVLSRRIAGHWQARSVALRQEWELSPSTDNALDLILAMHSVSARSSEIDQVISLTDMSLGTSLAGAKLYTRLAFSYCVQQHDLDAALRLLNDVEKKLPEFGSLFDATEEHLRFLTIANPAPPALDARIKKADGLGAESLISVQAEALVAAGATTDALALLDTFMPEDEVFQSHARVTRALALVIDGRVEEGVALALKQVNEARMALLPGSLLSNTYVAALGLALRGDFRALDRVLSSAFTLVDVPPMYEHYRVGLVVLGATAARWQDRPVFAEMFADQAISLRDPDGPFPAMVPDSARLLDPNMGVELAAGALWELAEERFAHGYEASGLFTGLLSVEMYSDVARGRTLGEFGRKSQSSLLRGFGEYGLAAGLRDAEALISVTEGFLAAGSPLLAVQAGITRAVILRERGAHHEAAAQADESWTLASGFGSFWGMFSRLAATIVLTDRELDIALAILHGDPPTRIADRLNLSVRTVENHVLNIYRKVGVDSRQRFVRAASTWMGLGA